LLERIAVEVGDKPKTPTGVAMADDAAEAEGVAVGAVRFVAVAPQFGSGGSAPVRPTDTPSDATARAALGPNHGEATTDHRGLATPLHIIEVHDLLASL
jgi:hypothetical protein